MLRLVAGKFNSKPDQWLPLLKKACQQAPQGNNESLCKKQVQVQPLRTCTYCLKHNAVKKKLGSLLTKDKPLQKIYLQTVHHHSHTANTNCSVKLIIKTGIASVILQHASCTLGPACRSSTWRGMYMTALLGGFQRQGDQTLPERQQQSAVVLHTRWSKAAWKASAKWSCTSYYYFTSSWAWPHSGALPVKATFPQGSKFHHIAWEQDCCMVCNKSQNSKPLKDCLCHFKNSIHTRCTAHTL